MNRPTLHPKSKLFLLAILTFCPFLLAAPGCSGSYVEARADTGYDYTYYPDSEVYYYAPDRAYYYRDHDKWAHGRHLPANYHLEHEHGVAVHMNTRHPYEMHEQIRAAHPSTLHPGPAEAPHAGPPGPDHR